METVLVKLKGDFNNIIAIRTSVKNVFDILQVRIDKLRQIYSEFIKSNQNEMFLFGLDSFHFQSKLIDIEHDDMKRLFLAINNRMYCEYFKLHKIIVDYISNNINDKKNIDFVKINNYPVYKDLEPFKEYNFEVILEIHESILNLLNVAISILNNRENELSIHKTKQNIGLNIDNFITTFNFNISVMREKIMMFINYIEFFHKMHTKYLKRFSNKIQLMYTHINHDIKFDDSIEVSKHKKKELIDDFVSNHIDRDLLKDLKTSIGSETSSEVSNSSGSKTSLDTFLDNNINEPSLHYNHFEANKNVIEEDKNRTNLKEIIQKNVQKITNVFKLNKSSTKLSEPHDDINSAEQLFSEINKSCDMIINDNIGLNIDTEIQSDNNELNSDDSKELLYNNFDNNVIEYFDYNKNENTIQITKEVEKENNDTFIAETNDQPQTNKKKKKRVKKKK
jgi:hypothetical protein